MSMESIDLLDDVEKPSFGEKLGFLKQKPSFATKAIHTGVKSDQVECSAIIPLINLTSTYKLAEAHNPEAYQYSRFGNPTRNGLESCLAALESSKYAVTFSSGLGAQTAVISSLKQFDGILVDCDVSYSCAILFKNLAVNMDMPVTFVDFNDSIALKNSINENLKLVWMETPTSHKLKVIDIAKVSNLIRQSVPNVRIVVDNTTLSSYFQRPLDFGADIVVYSITKYMHGHSDVTMGSLAINDDKIHDKLKYHQGAMGVIPSPFDCFMVNRSLKTLALRLDLHMKNAFKVAKFLENHALVEKVFHPALKSHPQHDIACGQSYGHSGVFSFLLKNDEKVENFLNSLRIFLQIESPGGFESFMKAIDGATEGRKLIIVSIGLENVEDLIGDVKFAMKFIE